MTKATTTRPEVQYTEPMGAHSCIPLRNHNCSPWMENSAGHKLSVHMAKVSSMVTAGAGIRMARGWAKLVNSCDSWVVRGDCWVHSFPRWSSAVSCLSIRSTGYYYYYYFFFLPSVGIFPREFKNLKKNWRVRYDHQSMQSEAGKLLCSKTALKRCTSTEHLWCYYLMFRVYGSTGMGLVLMGR